MIPNVLFCEFNACGHKHTYFCKCGIFGTHKICNQPHYIILADNNKICYAPQSFVSICPPKWINNIEIGQYFSRFENTHYVPNKALANAYPYDIAAIPRILSNSLC
ncbi:F-box only protein 21 [Formica fusca]